MRAATAQRRIFVHHSKWRGFAANFPRIERSTTTEEKYARTVKSFSLKPEPPGG